MTERSRIRELTHQLPPMFSSPVGRLDGVLKVRLGISVAPRSTPATSQHLSSGGASDKAHYVPSAVGVHVAGEDGKPDLCVPPDRLLGNDILEPKVPSERDTPTQAA